MMCFDLILVLAFHSFFFVVAVQRNQFLLKICFKRFKYRKVLSLSVSTRSKKANLHILHRVYLCWKKYHERSRRFSSKNWYHLSHSTGSSFNSYQIYVVKPHFLQWKQRTSFLSHFQKMMKVSIRYSSSFYYHRYFERWKYHHSLHQQFPHFSLSSTASKDLLSVSKRKTFDQFAYSLLQPIKQRSSFLKAMLLHKRKQFQRFKKQVFYATTLYSKLLQSYYRHGYQRRFLRKLRSCLLQKKHGIFRENTAFYHFFVHKSSLFLLLLKRKAKKKKEMRSIIRFCSFRKSFHLFRATTDRSLSQKIAFKRGILRHSVQRLSSFFRCWYSEIQKRMLLRRKFFYYQQLRKLSYFPSSVSSSSSAIVVPSVSYSSTAMSARRSQILQQCFFSWKNIFLPYSYRVNSMLQRFSWKYQCELLSIIFRYWFNKYEKKVIQRNCFFLAYKRWKKKSFKKMTFLLHLEKMIMREKQVRASKPNHLCRLPSSSFHELFRSYYLIRSSANHSRGSSNLTILARLKLSQLYCLHSFFHQWYHRYYNKRHYYTNVIHSFSRLVIDNISFYHSCEEKVKAKNQFRLLKQSFSYFRRVFQQRKKKIQKIQQNHFLKPFYYHWVRLYNYNSMKNILQIPSLVKKNILNSFSSSAYSPRAAFSPSMVSTTTMIPPSPFYFDHSSPSIIDDKETLSQHLQQLKRKISLHQKRHCKAEPSKSSSIAEKENHQLQKGFPLNSNQQNKQRSSVYKSKQIKLIGDLSYIDLNDKQQHFRVQSKQITTTTAKEQRKPLTPTNNIKKKNYNSNLSSLGPHNNSCSSMNPEQLMVDTFLSQHDQRSSSFSPDLSSQQPRNKNDDSNHERISSSKILTSQVNNSNKTNNSFSGYFTEASFTKIDYEHTFQEYVKNRSYLGKYDLQKQHK
jgi:hypothetical protein